MLMVMGGGGFKKHMPSFDNNRIQANDEEEEEVDRDVKMMGGVEVEIMPQVVEINCKISRGEKPFLRMKLFDICVYHRYEH